MHKFVVLSYTVYEVRGLFLQEQRTCSECHSNMQRISRKVTQRLLNNRLLKIVWVKH